MKSSRDNDKGAVMVVGAFMAIFLVGILYTLLGIGETVAYQEEIQQVADTGAFSAAVVHARGMNMVAVVNASIATAMATLSALSLAVLAIPPAGACDLPEGCEEVRAYHESVETDVRPSVEEIVRAASRAAGRVVDVTPDLAATEVEALATELHGDRVLRAFLVPADMAAVRTDTRPACALAIPEAYPLAREALGPVLAERWLRGFPRVDRDALQCERSRIDEGPWLPDPPNVPMGAEPFQVRVVVLGDASRVQGFGAGVRVPARVIGRPSFDARGWAPPTDEDRATTLAVAQAEYHCDGEHVNLEHDGEVHTVDEEGFRMCWRARLRRFRVPTGGTTDRDAMDRAYDEWVRERLLPACGPECGALLDLLAVANDAAH